MNEFLKKYLKENEIKELLCKLENNQRTNILTNTIFIKIGNNSDDFFFKNLLNEIHLYESNKNNPIFPKIIDSYKTDSMCILVLERIKGAPLGIKRNEFNINISDKKRNYIIENILKIKDLKQNIDLDNSFNRKDKIKKYYKNINCYLDDDTKRYLEENIERIGSCKIEYVISHGDLICPNILIDKNKIKFIDWEYIGYRPATYDLANFLLFSKENNCYECIKNLKLSENFKNELYKDGIYFCLKEINNWNKLISKVEKKTLNDNIERWKNELKLLISIRKKLSEF